MVWKWDQDLRTRDFGTEEPGTRDPPQSLKVGHILWYFLHYFPYFKYKYCVYEKLRNVFNGNNFPSDILCSQSIHHFLENFKFCSVFHVTLGVLNIREGVFFGGARRDFVSKANKQLQWKWEVVAICLTYHLSTNWKIWHKFSPTSH